MPRDSSGNTQPLPGTIVSTGDTVLPSQHNPMVNDVYAMMTQSLSRDGQGGMRSNLDMSGFRIINVAMGAQSTDVAQISQLPPLGVPMPYLGTTSPAGYIFCFGQAISRTDNAALFAVLGTTYGIGDGSTTFNIPDLRGRTLAGKDNMGGTAAGRLTNAAGGGVVGSSLGASGGEQAHQINTLEMPSHTHGVNDPGHAHSYNSPNFVLDNDRGGLASVWSIDQAPILSTNSSTTGITIQNSGGNIPINVVQPTIVVNYILRTGV